MQNCCCLLQLRDDQNRVWLLLFDLHLRHFKRRDPQERAKEKELYDESDLQGKIKSKIVWIIVSSIQN